MEFVENYKGCVINKKSVGGRWVDGVWVGPRYDYSVFFPDGTVCALTYDSAEGARSEIDKVADAFVRVRRKFEWAFFLEFLGGRKGDGIVRRR
ncbi:hypothetical protein HGO40_25315 [Pseudomonas sp. CG7]|uniref:hypothetical protein n=1 Tax=Pseudomonas sp. CG7 TaxID=191007 RepID=UPI0020336133|nr:hypothetical protein [Pseudomonas sp. CG7]MCM2463745.1 hypothetical protein [Pseudomonas sp. CG7]